MSQISKVLVFGNALFKPDSLALTVSRKLKKDKSIPFEFVECDTSESIEDFGHDLIILDVALGIKTVCLLDDISVIEKSKPYSLHDFDLGLTLNLLKKMGKLDSVKIIAIPVSYDERMAEKEVKSLLLSKSI